MSEMYKGTALERAEQIAREIAVTNVFESASIWNGISKGLHPQERTLEFHRLYSAPIHNEMPDVQMSHMSNERIAFRLSFILSECIELLDKGFGVKTEASFYSTKEGRARECFTFDPSDADISLCETIQFALDSAGLESRDIYETADALGDLNVVVNGFAIEIGLDMDAIDREIMASNFTKMGTDGRPIIGDGKTGPVGKVLKGPNYMEPQLKLIIETQEGN